MSNYNDQIDISSYIFNEIKQFDFFKFDSSLNQLETLRVSNTKSVGAEVFGIDIEAQFRSVMVNECVNGLIRKSFTKILNNGNNVDYVMINDIALDFNFPPDLIHHIYKYNYKNMVMSSKMGASIQDTAGYKPSMNNKLTINTSGMMYKIGTFYNFEVWVDPYMKYNDHRIIFFDDIHLNIGKCEQFEVADAFSVAMRNEIRLDYQVEAYSSATLYVIGSKDDPQYGEYLKVQRDSKIDTIID